VVCSRHSRNQKCVKHFDLKTWGEETSWKIQNNVQDYLE
jgi:hypothetical protein